jgi:hypothetical protein
VGHVQGIGGGTYSKVKSGLLCDLDTSTFLETFISFSSWLQIFSLDLLSSRYPFPIPHHCDSRKPEDSFPRCAYNCFLFFRFLTQLDVVYPRPSRAHHISQWLARGALWPWAWASFAGLPFSSLHWPWFNLPWLTIPTTLVPSSVS